MNKIKEVKKRFEKLYTNFEQYQSFQSAIDNIFFDQAPIIKDFEESLENSLKDDAKIALDINREYFDLVQSRTLIYNEVVRKNNQTITESINEHELNIQQFFKTDAYNKAQSKLILANAEISTQSKILEAEDKLNKLILVINEEKEVVKNSYLTEADKLVKNREKELRVINVDFQTKVEKYRIAQVKRQEFYEAERPKLRQIREQYVLDNNEIYKRIKENHTSFSIYYNQKIDELSTLYRQEIKKLNDDNQQQISVLDKRITEYKNEILMKENEINVSIAKHSDNLQQEFLELKNKYDNELRLIISKNSETIKQIEENHLKYEMEIKSQIENLNQTYEQDEKSNNLKKDYLAHTKNYQKLLNSNQRNKIKNIKEQQQLNQIAINTLNAQFSQDKFNLDLNFLNFELEALTKKEKFIINNQKEIELLNLSIEVLEEEKNRKIGLLTNAYNKEMAYLERVLAIGSINQELMIQDQVGEHSYLLAENIYQSEVLRIKNDDYIQQIETKIKTTEIIHKHQLQQITSFYQLLVQKEITKRDTLLQQYDFEIKIAEESLKKLRYEYIFEYDFLKLKTEYELEQQLNKGNKELKTLEYHLNVKKIKLENITKKREGNLQLQILRAKAARNHAMDQLDVEKNDRFYFGNFEMFFSFQNRINSLNHLLQISYKHQDFTTEQFYLLIDLYITSINEFKNLFSIMLTSFYENTNLFFDKKVEELTNFRYLNKIQELIDSHNRPEELIQTELANIKEDKTTLERNLNNLDAIRHKHNIEMSTIYDDIQLLKKQKYSSKNDERIVLLETRLSNIKNQMIHNDKTAKQYEKQIKFREKELKPLKHHLEKLTKSHLKDKKNVINQLNRDAKVYHRQRNKNNQLCNDLNAFFEYFSNQLIKNIIYLKQNLGNKVEVLNVYNRNFEKYRDTFNSKLHYFLEQFRNLLLTIYIAQIKEQNYIVQNFNNSYSMLMRNLNRNYVAAYSSEKNNFNSYINNFGLKENKLYTDYLVKNEQIDKTLKARIANIENQLNEYDLAFKNLFLEQEHTLQLIDFNGVELIQELDCKKKNLIENTNKEYLKYDQINKDYLKQELINLETLKHNTLNRSTQYRKRYLNDKNEIIYSLKTWRKENLEIINEKQRTHRDNIKEFKRDESLLKKKFKITQAKTIYKIRKNYYSKLKEIKINVKKV